MHIGFIGLGNMGSELVRHLLAAGHTLATYARGERSHAHASRASPPRSRPPASTSRAITASLPRTIISAPPSRRPNAASDPSNRKQKPLPTRTPP